MTLSLPVHWPELVTWPQSQQRHLGNVKELLDILVSTSCLFHTCEKGNSIIPVIFTDDEKLEQRKNNLPKSTLLVSNRLAILTNNLTPEFVLLKIILCSWSLNNMALNCMGPFIYADFFSSKYVPQYYMIHGYWGLTVKGHVDFRLHRVGHPNPCIV